MHDIRYAVRMLAKDGWFTVSCVIALALGIGATTAGFTLANAALLRTLPVKDADRVVHLSTRDVSNREAGLSYLDFEDWRSDAASLSEMAASLDTAFGLATQKRVVRTLNVFARLRDGTTINQAQTEFATIAGRLTHDHPDTNKNVVPVIVTLSEYMQGGPLRTILLTLMGTVVFVLLIACANIANLMLARAANRAQEITIRISLGATQWRIIQQLLVECVLLTTVASTVGFALAAYAVRLFALGDKEGALDQQPYCLGQLSLVLDDQYPH